MMVVPVDDGLVYVEPIFLQAESGRLPELKRVIVAHGSQIAMRETLGQALAAVISGDVEELVEPPAEPLSAEMSDDIDNLVESAHQHFVAAQECLQRGDWTCYGEEQEGLRQDLDALLALNAEESVP
jgi:hypothetical protein